MCVRSHLFKWIFLKKEDENIGFLPFSHSHANKLNRSNQTICVHIFSESWYSQLPMTNLFSLSLKCVNSVYKCEYSIWWRERRVNFRRKSADFLYLNSLFTYIPKHFSLCLSHPDRTPLHLVIISILCQALCCACVCKCVLACSFILFDLYIYRSSNDSELLKSILLTFYWLKIAQSNCQK